MPRPNLLRSSQNRGLTLTLVLVAAGLFLSIGIYVSAGPAASLVKASGLPAASLTFGERVSYQRAIEKVYWRHRIWPKENPFPKPPLDAVMPQLQLEKKVTDYLLKSQVLAEQWQRPITAEQLQAEIDRMAQHTKRPDELRELSEALGNDPFVIAECLARPALAERLLAGLSTGEQDMLTSRRSAAEIHMPIAAAGAAYTLPSILEGPGCTDDTWMLTSTTNAPEGRQGHTTVWTGNEMIIWGGSNGVTSVDSGGRYNPSTDSWAATSTTNAPSQRFGHTAVWTGSEMIVWGGNYSGYYDTGGRYDPTSDSWTTTSTTNAPAGRWSHSAVWTGIEMIVWGGRNATDPNTGGRYDPNTDSWIATSTTNAPAGRDLFTAVWTGDEMIIWGGSGNTGGRYEPVTDSWTATSLTNAPSGRFSHTAVWSGSNMIVWGGYSGGYLNTGGRYDPNTDSWTATTITNAPPARYLHSAVWTGSEMIVWGGSGAASPSYLDTGARYDPATDTWTATSITNVPLHRNSHTAVWTGSEMIVWGGDGIQHPSRLNTGGRYCARSGPTPTNTPTPTPTATATAMPTATPTATPPFPQCNAQQITVMGSNFDNVLPPTLPSGWTATNAIDPDGIQWQTSNMGPPLPPAYSPPNAAWVNDPPVISDKYLHSETFYVFEASWGQLRFGHNFNLQSGFDGGVLEISSFYINNGAFTDITDPAVGGTFVTGGYNSTIATGTGSPIAGRQAWSGNSDGFITTIVNLPNLVVNGKLRWRMASDNSGPGEGWRVDNVTVTECHFTGTPTPSPTFTPTPTPTNTATATPTATPTNTPTASPTPFPELDLRISQSDSPDPVRRGRQLTYTLIVTNAPSILGGFACPVVNFKFPSGVPIALVSATGTNGYVSSPTPNGLTFTRGCLNSIGGTATATISIVVIPLQTGTLTSIGTDVVVDPANLIPESFENNNTAATIQTTVIESNVGTLFDFDGDHRSDISVYRPSAGNWYIQRSTAGFFGLNFGVATDRMAPADYDGDGKTDIAVYRPSTGIWYVTNSSNGAVNYYGFGIAEDLPTPADYDGDGKADIAVFRPSSGTWYRINSSNGAFLAFQFGASGDLPTLGDFDGDTRSDIAVFRPSTGAWYQMYSSNGTFFGEQFGISTDKITQSDYDADGKTDIAIYRPSDGLWYVKRSATGTYVPYVFGLAGDIPVPADFDGDGRADIAVFRPSDGTWYIVNSTNGTYTIYQFGQNGDMPTESAFSY